MGQYGFELIGHHLCYDFVNYITEGDGSELFGFVTHSSFGMRVRKVALRAGRTWPDALDSSTTSQTSSLTRSQQWWKKSVVNPSGPGDFPRGIDFTAWSTSSWVMGRIRAVFCSRVTREGMCLVTLWMDIILSSLVSIRRSLVVVGQLCLYLRMFSDWISLAIL
jgi:hypothetical protein